MVWRGGGGGRNNNNNNGRGRGGGRHGGGRFGRGGRGRGGDGGGRPLLQVCRNFATNGNCQHGDRCNFSHCVQLHASVTAAPPKNNNNNNNNNQNNNYRGNKSNNGTPVASIAIWEHQGTIKIFTGSHDGYWRLWNTTNGQFVQEFEHCMGGQVDCCQVRGPYLVCGCEAPPKGGTVPVGMTHVWDLGSPQQAPMELVLQNDGLMPYAHNSAVTALAMVPPDTVVTGSRDGSIRIWKLNSTGPTPTVELVSSLPGHARQVTAVLHIGNTTLWTAGLDHCIRIWDIATQKLLHCISNATNGHSNAVTGLLSYQAGADLFVISCSLDQSVKVWNTSSGECVASESTGDSGIVCMCLAQDSVGTDVLLLGTEHGTIQGRSVVGGFANVGPLQSLFSLQYHATGIGHEGAVQCLIAGPAATFYSGGSDGRMLVMSFPSSIPDLLQKRGGGQQR